jgi:glycosyltransferase involved in cell wall biosynthesis
MRIAYFTRDNGGCTYYRAHLPLQRLAKHKLAEVLEVPRGATADIINQSTMADIIIIPRIIGDQDRLIKVQEEGKKLVVDFDDLVFEVTPASNHYFEWGLKNFNMETPDGEIVPLWEDGKNFDIEKNRKRHEQTKDTFRIVDCVTTTTEVLRQKFLEYNKCVKALPNCIDFNKWQKLPLVAHEHLRLYWAGGSSHYWDLMILKELFPPLLMKYPQLKIVIQGQMFAGIFKECPHERFEIHNWVDTCCYPYKSAILNPDICFIPLVDDEFNRCKSPIKWEEMAALEIPCVVSHVSPYKEIYNGKNAIMIDENDLQSWWDGLCMLIESAKLREEIGTEARKYVKEHFDIDKECKQWLQAYKEVLYGE